MKLFDYFTGSLLCEAEFDDRPKFAIYDQINVEAIEVMVFAVSEERQELLVAPPDGGVLPLKFSFPRNLFECGKCGMQFNIGVTEQKFFEWHDKEWDLGLDLSRTVKIIKIVDKTHKELCDLIRPVELIT